MGFMFKLCQAFLILISLTNCQKVNLNSIKEINSFNEVDFEQFLQPPFNEATFSQIDLVIFDVDETLIQPTDAYLINEHTEEGRNFLNKLVQSHPDVKNWAELTSIIVLSAKRPLIESSIISKIDALKDKGVKVIALSGMNTGKAGTIERIEAWRHDHLRSHGFKPSYDDQSFTWQEDGKHPSFYRGILATDVIRDKGKILKSWLDKMKLKPRWIVMFEDDLEMLKSVQKVCERDNIFFQGFLYKGAKSKPWDEELINFQAEYLIKHKQWLDDIEAKKKMRQTQQRIK